MSPAEPSATLVNLYYHDLEAAMRFWAEGLRFPVVVDQGWAKILRLGEGSYLGLVDGQRGYHRPQEKSAVLITIVTDDLTGWWERAGQAGAQGLTPIQINSELQIERFFCRDPGGYTLEFQRFLNPQARRVFHRTGGCA